MTRIKLFSIFALSAVVCCVLLLVNCNKKELPPPETTIPDITDLSDTILPIVTSNNFNSSAWGKLDLDFDGKPDLLFFNFIINNSASPLNGQVAFREQMTV